ncbi:S8 family serine peptidase [Streptomyces sp. NPDC093982]|uniref:S8 family serine peptidase n=1 Tax=Streptomyces sp. NPDC093982 TaxID=3155077 RepID=UPI0034414BB7
MDNEGSPVGVQRPEGREHIPIAVSRSAGHTYAIPLDAQRLLGQGKIDQRLFDLTVLSRAEYRKANSDGLRLIVNYQHDAAHQDDVPGKDARSADAAARKLRAAGNTQIRHTYTRLHAQAITADRARPGRVWEAVTVPVRGEGATRTGHQATDRTLAAGLGKIWLDGIYRATLDKSVRQIGAPSVWKAGYNGKGTKIAVLDTGVDQTHPDLKFQEIEERNFSNSPDTKDRVGHGTHVASIAAGTGAKSGGTYTGVAPGAKILDGKVLGDGGGGATSGIIAGMEWAVAEGADIVNLSLGSLDLPGSDPLEEAVNRLSEQTGTLFVVAAGNSGASGLGSPGSADAALTVGAVDKQDALAAFSSTGPRIGDGAIKPDLTAPGVDIGAAAAAGSAVAQSGLPVADGYVALSGTSMATPHVAGAAALLKQRHPDWNGRQIKAGLTSSALPRKEYSPFQQGAGRTDVALAVRQAVVAEQGTLSFGSQRWPHHDDKAATQQLTYRNYGSRPVSLKMTVRATGPDGRPAPRGMFAVGHKRVTVPAHGTATVPVTVDTRLGGSTDGTYSAYLSAHGGGQNIRTAVAVDREIESYDIRLRHLGRDGKPSSAFFSYFLGIDGPGKGRYVYVDQQNPDAAVRLSKGRWAFSSVIRVSTGNQWQGGDWIAAPKFEVTGDATVTVDARTAKPLDFTVPDATATAYSAFSSFEIKGTGLGVGVWLPGFTNVRTAHLGPEAAPGELRQQFHSTWRDGIDGSAYSLGYGFEPTTLATGYTKHAQPSELASITMDLGASVPGRTGYLAPIPQVGSSLLAIGVAPRELPRTLRLHVNAAEAAWGYEFAQFDQAATDYDIYYSAKPVTYRPGESYRESFNVGVVGPTADAEAGVFRDGDTIQGNIPAFADGRGHHGSSRYDRAVTTLYRSGREVATQNIPLLGGRPFTVPADLAHYRLTTTMTRSKVATVSTRVTSTWTFHSARTEKQTALPISAIRYSPDLAPNSTAPAGAVTRIPVTVEGAAAQGNLKSLRVQISYDDGKTWKRVAVSHGEIMVRNPESGKGISFKAKATDRQGNTVTQTIHNAYLGA